jgi:hypothetical protein
VSQARVRIFGIEVIDRGQTVGHFGPVDLRSWHQSGLVPREDSASFAFETLTGDPVLYASTTVHMTAGSWLRDYVLDFGVPLRLLQQWLFDRPYSLPGLLLPILLLAGGRPIMPMVMIALTIGLMPLIVSASHGWRPSPKPLGVAVSRASFLAHPLVVNQLVSMAGLGLAIALGAAAAWRARVHRVARTGNLPLAATPLDGRSVLIAWWFVLVVAFAPDLQASLIGVGTYAYEPHWDFNNLVYWAYLVARGDLPFRDFWYPYAGQYLFHSALPAGPLVQWAFEVLTFGAFTTSLWVLARERRSWVVPVAAVLVVLDRTGLVYVLARYLLSINVVLGYFAVCRGGPFKPGSVLLAGFIIGLPLVFEPAQLVYALPALVVVALLDLPFDRPRTGSAVLARLHAPALFAGLALLMGVATGAVLASTGQLPGVLEFHRTLGANVEYSALPTTLPSDWRVLELSAAVLWWPVLAVAAGLFERLSASSELSRLRGNVLLGLGLVTFMVLQKHFIRPMEWQLAAFLLVGGLAFAIFTPGRISSAAAGALGLAAGLVAAFFSTTHAYQARTATIGSPARFAGSIATLTDWSRFAPYNRDRFAPERFVKFVEERALVSTLKARAGRSITLFALSDMPVFYILTRQPAVWHSGMYNASPAAEQRRVVEWLDRNKPDFVVFDSSQLTFDQVPLAARVPAVLGGVVEGYVRELRSGRYEVLRRRASAEPVSIDYWRTHLGTVLHLGHLPGLIDIEGRDSCGAGGTCDEYLIVDAPQGTTAGDAAWLGFEVNGTAIDIRFDLDPGRTRYVVPLSRLWFWRAAAVLGTRPTLVRRLSPSFTITPIRLAHNPERVY